MLAVHRTSRHCLLPFSITNLLPCQIDKLISVRFRLEDSACTSLLYISLLYSIFGWQHGCTRLVARLVYQLCTQKVLEQLMVSIDLFNLIAGEAITASANFTVEKNSSRIDVPDSFTLYRSSIPKPEAPTAAAVTAAPAAASATATAAAPALARKSSESTLATAPPASRPPGLDGAPLNTFRLTLHPVGAGTYPSKVVLASGGDVRVLDVEFVAVKTGQQVALEFNSPARDKLVQEVGLPSRSSMEAVHFRAAPAVCYVCCF